MSSTDKEVDSLKDIEFWERLSDEYIIRVWSDRARIIEKLIILSKATPINYVIEKLPNDFKIKTNVNVCYTLYPVKIFDKVHNIRYTLKAGTVLPDGFYNVE